MQRDPRRCLHTSDDVDRWVDVHSGVDEIAIHHGQPGKTGTSPRSGLGVCAVLVRQPRTHRCAGSIPAGATNAVEKEKRDEDDDGPTG